MRLQCSESKNPVEIFYLTLWEKWQLRGDEVPLFNQEPIFICWDLALRRSKPSSKGRKGGLFWGLSGQTREGKQSKLFIAQLPPYCLLLRTLQWRLRFPPRDRSNFSWVHETAKGGRQHRNHHWAPETADKAHSACFQPWSTLIRHLLFPNNGSGGGCVTHRTHLGSSVLTVLRTDNSLTWVKHIHT